MKHIFLIALIGIMAAILSACGAPGASPNAAAEQFLTARNDGTPVALGGSGPIIGTIDRISDTELVINSPLQGSATVQLSEATVVRKQADVELSAITVGATITVFGTQTSDGMKAHSVQIGTGGMLGGVTMIGEATTPLNSSASGPAAPQGADQILSQAGAAPVSGTVTKLDGQTLTLQQPNGSELAVELSDATTVHQQQTVKRDELRTGMFVAATRQQGSNGMAAELIEILPPPTMQ